MLQPSIRVIDYEMVHYASDDLFIAHKADTITYKTGNDERRIKMPPQIKGWKKLCLPFRKLRRLLRLDKAMIIPTESGMVMTRLGEIWVYDLDKASWRKSEQKLNCRNPMYNGILRLDSGEIFLGEYGNPNGIGKRILSSTDNGSTWTVVYQFAPDEIRHIHCLAWDRYEEKIWIFTGDSNAECKVLKTDKEFQDIESVGGGSQEWRACHAMFTEQSVTWIMDSPLEEVHQIEYSRDKQAVAVGQVFAGPVWFAREYDDGVAIAASAQEIGPSHKDKYLHIYRSDDLKQWSEIYRWEHDGWPKRWFRFGTITVCRGSKSILSCEGIKKYDGKSIKLLFYSHD